MNPRWLRLTWQACASDAEVKTFTCMHNEWLRSKDYDYYHSINRASNQPSPSQSQVSVAWSPLQTDRGSFCDGWKSHDTDKVFTLFYQLDEIRFYARCCNELSHSLGGMLRRVVERRETGFRLISMSLRMSIRICSAVLRHWSHVDHALHMGATRTWHCHL